MRKIALWVGLSCFVLFSLGLWAWTEVSESLAGIRLAPAAAIEVEGGFCELALRFKISSDKLLKLRPDFQAAADQLQKAPDKAFKAHTLLALARLGPRVRQIQRRLHARMAKVLTRQEMAEYDRWWKARQDFLLGR